MTDFQKLNFQELATLTKQFLETRVVTISSMQEEEVYNIFEILNARGVKLKQIELLKNYLFKYLKPKSLLDTYKTKWGDLEQRLEKVDLDDYYLHMYRCWHYKNRLKKEQLFEITKEQLRENNQKDLPKFFDFFIQGSEYYYGIDSVVGDDIEKEVYEYFKLKRNKQVRSVLLALKMKYAEEILDIDSYHQYLMMLRNFWVTFNLDNGSSNKIDMYPLYWTTSKEGIFMRYSYEFKMMCVELYHSGSYPDIPEGLNPNTLKRHIREWSRLVDLHGPEVLKHKVFNKVWTPEEKLELISKVIAGTPRTKVAIEAGINAGLLYQWVHKYKLQGYNGLVESKKGRPTKEPRMKKSTNPLPLTESEREELIRLRTENEYIKAENEVIKKRIALRQEKWVAQLKAKKQQSSKNSEKKDIN